ncbi:MAG TPA: hypothetical protein PK765_04415 [bacterium]|nr:hypothetical protein [bacterium]
MIPDSTDFDLGSDNFTIEAWINVPSGGGGYVFAKWFGQGTSSPYYFAATNA